MTDEEVRKLLLGSPDLAVADHVSLKDAKELLGISQTAILHEVGAKRVELWSRVPAMAANGYCTDIRNLAEAEGIPGTRPLDAMDVEAGGELLRVIDDDLAAKVALTDQASVLYTNAYGWSSDLAFVPETPLAVETRLQDLLVPARQLEAIRGKLIAALTPERRQSLTPKTVCAAENSDSWEARRVHVGSRRS